MTGIADTGFLVAFANRNDRHHDWAVSVAGRVTEPLLTCEAVLAETAFHLRNVPLVLAMIRDGLIDRSRFRLPRPFTATRCSSESLCQPSARSR